MGRFVSESPSTSALAAAESEDNAHEYALDAAESKELAKEYAEQAAYYADKATNIGINTATIYIYQRRSLNIAPPPPTVTSMYYFGTGEVSILDNGWSIDLPSSGGDFLFVCYAIVTAQTGMLTTEVTPDKWSDAQLMAQSGSGESTTAFWMTRSAGTIQKDTSNVYTPSFILIKGLKVTGGGPVQPYYTRFIVSATYDGSEYVDMYISPSDEPSVSFTVPPDIKALRVRMYQPGGTDTMVHEETIPVVNDGISYVLKIESTNGDTFRVGHPTTTLLKAHVFRNGVEVTDTINPLNFRWRRVSMEDPPPPNDDATWNSNYERGYREISLTIDSVYSRATFHCDIVVDD